MPPAVDLSSSFCVASQLLVVTACSADVGEGGPVVHRHRQVTDGDDAHRLAVLLNGNPANLLVPHQLCCVVEGCVRRECDDAVTADLVELRLARVAPFGDP